jgi:hypothetical protein
MIRKTSTILVALTIIALLTACGTAQTATPATSTNTVVSATGTATAESTSEIPVTGETATATPEVNASPSTAVQTPAPMGQKLETEAQWEVVALELAQAAGFTTVESEIYQLPDNTTWESTLAYYQAQAAAAGWGDAPAQTNEIAGGHSAVWNVTIDGTTHYFVVAQLDSTEGSFTVNLSGH